MANENTLLNIVHNTFLLNLKKLNTKKIFLNFIQQLEKIKIWVYEECQQNNSISNSEQFMKYFNLQVPIKQQYYSYLPVQDKVKLMCCFFFKFFNRIQLFTLFGDFWSKIKLYFEYKTHIKV